MSEQQYVPVIVEVALAETGEWSNVERAEANIARALRLCYPDAPVKVVTAHTLPASMAAPLEAVLADGPEGMMRRMAEMLADPDALTFITEVMQQISEAMAGAVEGGEAPDDLSSAIGMPLGSCEVCLEEGMERPYRAVTVAKGPYGAFMACEGHAKP